MPPKKIIFFLFFSLFISRDFFSQATDTLSGKKQGFIELSFGQSLLFIGSSRERDIREKQDIVLATSALLFFAELRPMRILRVPFFINVPTESKQFLIDGVLVNEKASLTFGMGASYNVFHFRVGEETRADVEIAPLASFIFDRANQIRVAPVLATRMRLLRGKYFSMYFGLSYSVGIDAFGLLYGTGSIF